MVHCKVVELESSDLLERIIGDDLLGLYVASLCQLEEKRQVSTSSFALL